MADTTRPEQRPEQRIAKLLARAGVASRREVERMIADGRVAVNGAAIDTPATLLRSLHGVTVDGQPVAAPPPARLFLFHKPTGVLVTERDPAGRPTIYDQLPRDLPRLVPVGRLDLNTEGLLLMTTDGGLKRQLELPASGVERAYRARAYGEVSQARLEELIEGVEIDGVRYGPIDANLERRTGANTWIELVLTEGKNREVRRVLEHLGLQVSRLIRTRYGPFVLGDLQPNEIGEVRQHDLVAFRRQIEKKQKPENAVAVTPLVPPRNGAGDPPKARGGAVAQGAARGTGKPRSSPTDDAPRPNRPSTPRAKGASGPPPRASSGRTRKDDAAAPTQAKRPARPPRRTDPEQPGPRPPRPGRPNARPTARPRRPDKR